jgi:hypothetical protein
MMPRHLTLGLSLGILFIATACGTGPQGEPGPSQPVPGAETPIDSPELEDRSAYTEVEPPADATLVGADPNQLALDLFGMPEPGEGNFSEGVVLLVESDQAAVVELTQTGLPDDSVEGQRYRLDFVPVGEQWQLDWAGQQWRCQEGRGSQDWTTELCL